MGSSTAEFDVEAAEVGSKRLERQLTAADQAYDEGNFDLATPLFEELARNEQHRGWSFFQLGRIARRNGDPAMAVSLFQAAAAIKCPPSGLEVETVLALHEAGHHDQLVAALRDFAAAVPPDITKADLEALLPAAHAAHELSPEALVGFYTLAVDRGSEDYLVLLRLAEAEERAGNYAAMAAKIEVLQPRLECWGTAALARALARLGRIEEAAELFERLCREERAEPFFDQYFDFVLAVAPEAGRLARFFEFAEVAGLPSLKLQILRLRQALAVRDAEAALACLNGTLAEGGEPSKWQLIDLLYLMLDRRNEEGHDLAAALLTSEWSQDAHALEALVNRAMALRDWRAAAELLALMALRTSTERSWIVTLKRFELACFRGDLADATALFRQLSPLESAEPTAVPAMYRYLAEIGNWDALFEDALRRLGTDFAFPLTGDLVVRATRRTGRRTEMLAHIEVLPGWEASPDLVRLYSVLALDILLRSEPLLDRPGLLSNLEKVGAPEDLARLDAFRCVLSRERRRHATRREAVFLCTNPAYLLGTVVAVETALSNNPELPKRAELVVCAATACLDNARRILDPIARRFGAKLRYLDARDACAATELKIRYGLFTGGYALGTEAYWRLYVARHLAMEARYDTAIYLDSDVMVGPRFGELLDTRRARTIPLLARLEVARQEVSAATLQHGLEPGTYFNSGVLALDLLAEETVPRLERAIAVAEGEPERLVFQDQCALNIAFAGASASLDEAFNRFVPPEADERVIRTAFADCGVLHFLDRPKPWDPMYRGAAGRLWLERWQIAARLVPHAVLRRALADAIG